MKNTTYNNILKLPFSERKNLLCPSIQILDKSTFDELCFQMFAPIELLDAWNNKTLMTPELFKRICHIAGQMESGYLTYKLCNNYPQYIPKSPNITTEEINRLAEETKDLTDDEIILYLRNFNPSHN